MTISTIMTEALQPYKRGISGIFKVFLRQVFKYVVNTYDFRCVYYRNDAITKLVLLVEIYEKLVPDERLP